MTSAALSLEALRYRWPGQAGDCLDIASFTVAFGERVFLSGESGSGKSTLLSLAAGVLRPSSGVVSLLDKPLSSRRASARDRLRVDHIGFIFQQFNLLPWLPVLDNVLLPCRFSARRAQRAGGAGGMEAEAQALLHRLGLAPETWRKPAGQLSVGQQQRVAAARALIGRPELLIADEPTSALDAGRQRDFMDLLQQSCADNGTALLFVSHDHRLADGFDRVVHLADINRVRVGGQA